jgi:GDP-L-fucose synthase
MLELEAICDNKLINIGAGEEFTIRHFAKLICEKVGYDFEAIQFDDTRYVGARSKCLVVKKMRALVPESKMTSLDVGLEKTIEWFWAEQNELLAAAG